MSCLGLEHARQAVDNQGSCPLCAVFMTKSLSRRLVCQISLSGNDPCLHTSRSRGEEALPPRHFWLPPAGVPNWTCSRGPRTVRLHVTLPVDDDDAVSNLFSSEDEEEDDVFATLASPWHVCSPWLPLHRSGMRVTRQPLLPPAQSCWMCANTQLPGWIFPGLLPLQRHPGFATWGRNCPWPGARCKKN